MTPIEAAILGLVEGLTEYLPVSSTGHLILTSALLGMDKTEESKLAVDTFDIVIQGGAILAVLGLYWPRVMQMLRGLLGRDPAGLRLLINLVIAFIPAATMGFLLHKKIEEKLFHPIPVLVALAAGGVIMIFIARWQRKTFRESSDPALPGTGARPGAHDHQYLTIEQLNWKQALIIGCIQCFALWPGTSRSMVTIVGGMLLGLRPKQAAEFSFLLALPTLSAACAYSAYKDHNGPQVLKTVGAVPNLIGFGIAAISAALAVKFLVGFLNKHGLALFGWYRLALCALMTLLVWKGIVEFS